MPRGDGTGPWGMGPRTGRGLGFCSGYATAGFMKGPGMGYGGQRMGRPWGGPGRGMGYGRGWYNRAPLYNAPIQEIAVYNPYAQAPISKDEELKFLKEEKSYIESQINQLAKRIEELEKAE